MKYNHVFNLVYFVFFFFFFFFRVSTLDQYNYSAADFMRQDVFNTISAYLASGQSASQDNTLQSVSESTVKLKNS